jgi:hypothetical protein
VRVEVRCPVPVIFHDGTEHAGRLFMVLYLDAGFAGSGVIELPCDYCRSVAKKSHIPVRRILHRFSLEGEFISTVTDHG